MTNKIKTATSPCSHKQQPMAAGVLAVRRRPPDPTRRDATTNVRTTLRAVCPRCPLFLSQSTISNLQTRYPQRIQPLTKASISLPFQQTASFPFSTALAPHKQDPISHITRPQYRPLSIGLAPYSQKQDHISHPAAASFLAGDSLASLPISLHTLADKRTLPLLCPVIRAFSRTDDPEP